MNIFLGILIPIVMLMSYWAGWKDGQNSINKKAQKIMKDYQE